MCMSETQVNQKFAQVVQKIIPHSTLLRTWSLTGGVSAQVTALELQRPDGQIQKMIMRQHGATDLQHNPQIAADEFKLLQILQSVGLAAPKPYYFDQSGQLFPTPYLVIEYIEGEPALSLLDTDDLVLQLATHLAQIHRVDAAKLDLAFLPPIGKGFGPRPAILDHTLDEGRIRDRLESIWPLSPQNRANLLHGDFWPGNILYRDGRIVAVIDWEDAKTGDPLADLANSRLEILWAFGRDAMHSFTQHYQALNSIDFNNLAYWDLCAALRPASKLAGWGLDGHTEAAMRQAHKWFISQAFAALAT
jgi:aminoglycoside phosphotransferase (APT) family kinase protein